jgi:hypothetical protein
VRWVRKKEKGRRSVKGWKSKKGMIMGLSLEEGESRKSTEEKDKEERKRGRG